MQDIKSIVNTIEIETNVKESIFSALYNDLPVAIYWMDKYGYFEGCNELELKILNISSMSDLIGKHSLDIGTACAWENSKKVIATKQGMVFEEKGFPDSEGQPHYFLSVKNPVCDKSGKVTGVFGLSIDISERKRAEAKLKRAKERADAILFARRCFLA